GRSRPTRPRWPRRRTAAGTPGCPGRQATPANAWGPRRSASASRRGYAAPGRGRWSRRSRGARSAVRLALVALVGEDRQREEEGGEAGQHQRVHGAVAERRGAHGAHGEL